MAGVIFTIIYGSKVQVLVVLLIVGAMMLTMAEAAGYLLLPAIGQRVVFLRCRDGILSLILSTTRDLVPMVGILPTNSEWQALVNVHPYGNFGNSPDRDLVIGSFFRRGHWTPLYDTCLRGIIYGNPDGVHLFLPATGMRTWAFGRDWQFNLFGTYWGSPATPLGSAGRLHFGEPDMFNAGGTGLWWCKLSGAISVRCVQDIP